MQLANIGSHPILFLVHIPFLVGNFLPFGLNVGDQSVFGDDASSGPQSKLAFANVVCPFLGTEESVLFVS